MKFLVSLILVFMAINARNMTTTQPMLHFLAREPKIKSEKPPVIILLHGVGSNEKDLFSFANQLPGRFLVISLRAPFTMGQEVSHGFRLVLKLESL